MAVVERMRRFGGGSGLLNIDALTPPEPVQAQPAPPEPDDPQRRPADRPRSLLRRYRSALGIALYSRLLVFIAVGGIGWVNRPKHSTDLSQVFLAPLAKWDAEWYMDIARFGYDPSLRHGNTPAFFPLWPLAMRAFRTISGMSMEFSGVMLSTALFVAAIPMVWRLTVDYFGPVIANRTCWYMSLAPMAFVFSMPYTEGLFLLLSAAVFLLLERGRYTQSCAIAAVATLARPTGILLAPAIAWRIWRDNDSRFDGTLVRRLLPIALLPAALVAFQVYLMRQFHEHSLFVTGVAENRGWGRRHDLVPLLTMPVSAITGVWDMVYVHDLGLSLSAFFAFTFFWLIVIGWRLKIPGEYLIYSLASLVVPAATGSYLGFGRFGTVLFPLFWVMALLGRNRRFDEALRTLLPVLMVVLIYVSLQAGTFTP